MAVSFFRWIPVFALKLTLIAVSAIPSFAADRPMNLLIISTDEHHFKTLGCYGGKIVGTPNIDWIASEGALCTSFYATTPVCSPSRASLVSGLYPQNTAVTTNNIPLNDSVVPSPNCSVAKDTPPAMPESGIWTVLENRSGRQSESLALTTIDSCSTEATGRSL